jgi:hypothetical protein
MMMGIGTPKRNSRIERIVSLLNWKKPWDLCRLNDYMVPLPTPNRRGKTGTKSAI